MLGSLLRSFAPPRVPEETAPVVRMLYRRLLRGANSEQDAERRAFMASEVRHLFRMGASVTSPLDVYALLDVAQYQAELLQRQ